MATRKMEYIYTHRYPCTSKDSAIKNRENTYSTHIPLHKLRTAKTDSSSQSSIFLQLPNARIVLRWVTFLILDFWCTIQLMIHQIISGHPRGPYIYFQTTMPDLLLGQRCMPTCPCLEQVGHKFKIPYKSESFLFFTIALNPFPVHYVINIDNRCWM